MVHEYSRFFPWFGFIVMVLAVLPGCNEQQNNVDRSDPLVKEQEKLPLPEGVTPLENCSYSARGPSLRNYSCTYRTKLKFAELFKFYDEQLQKNGWRQAGVTKTFDWGRDLGGQAAYFCKNTFQMSLQYSGDKSNSSWQYGLDTSVGVPPNHCESS